MYTIGQVSEMFQLPISTLRYYDKEGLFPNLERQSGRRLFSEGEIEALRVIECLKASGLERKRWICSNTNAGTTKQRFRMEMKTESTKCFLTIFRLPFRLYITMGTDKMNSRPIREMNLGGRESFCRDE